MTDFEQKILKYGQQQNNEKLTEVIKGTSTQDLITGLLNRISTDAITFFDYLLKGFPECCDYESKEKRFACVVALLKHLNTVEVSYRQTSDLITRLCLDLSTFPSEHLIEMLEMSIDALKMGDAKCVGWKDLIPETVHILSTIPSLRVHDVQMSGADYRNSVVKNLFLMKWPIEVLTPIADMFKDLQLSSDEVTTLLKKFASNLQKLAPSELPGLAFQLFTLCSTATQVLIPVVAFQEYFHHYYYKKLFADMESNSTDFDSIDKYSDKELREAEETILHHLSFCTEFKISELQMCAALRGLSSAPDLVLSSFMLSAILSMTQANRYPESRLKASVILPYLRNVIKVSEDERELAKTSAWCRNNLHVSRIDLDHMFTVLIDQNKEGKDVVTPGLVSLAFVLLKTKNAPKLNAFAISFLIKFIKKRFIFGRGIVKNLAEWMVLDQEELQYAECLTMLSESDTFTVSECVTAINYVLDFFSSIPEEHAMRMMAFIVPVIKMSHTIRDSFIEVLKKAIRDPKTCRMAVYGLCKLLMQLTNNNSQRTSSASGGNLTQLSISGCSVMTQATLGSRSNPQRHFDMLTLEIVGLLSKAVELSPNVEIKETLYEGLSQAVELNPKLIPHVLRFVESHFCSYFEIEDIRCEVKFEKIVKSTENDHEIEVTDNLGRLTMFAGMCANLCDRKGLSYDTRVVKRLFAGIIEKIVSKDFHFSVPAAATDYKKHQLHLQHLNFLESLVAYSLWTSKVENDNVRDVLELFKIHWDISEGLKTSAQSKKTSKKAKGPNESDAPTQNVTINGVPVKRTALPKPKNIWDLATVERFLRLLFEDIVPFACPAKAAPLRTSRDLIRYVLHTAAFHLEGLRNEPQYKQIHHSRPALKSLINVTKVVYERVVKRLPNLWANFDITTAYLGAECLLQSLLTADKVFKKKFDQYLKGFDFQPITSTASKTVSYYLQDHVDQTIIDEEELQNEPDGKKIAPVLLQCLEILYENHTIDDRLTMDAYTWLLKFCQNNEVNSKELGLVHKMLFVQREKTHSSSFYPPIVTHLEEIFGKIDDEAPSTSSLEFKSITEVTSESCATHLCNTIRKQIEDVDYFVTKANSVHFKLKVTAEENQEHLIEMLRTMERSICTQLVNISNTLFLLTNVCLPLGTCMDNLLRVLMQFYLCLTNCTKHFIVRNATIPMSLHGSKFDQVMKIAGKPLSNRIYALITYIEANNFEGPSAARKSNDPQAAKAKVLKESKFIPKLILRVETFNTFVIHLSKKTKSELANYLHLGTVRDFRIQTSALKEAIDESVAEGSQIEVDESQLEQPEENDEEEVLERLEREVRPKTTLESSDGSGILTESGHLEHESNNESNTQVLRNMAKVNEKSKKKRSAKEAVTEDGEPSEEPKAKRGRRSKKST